MEGSTDPASSGADVADEMAALWAAHRENSLRRLKVLDDAAAALASGSLDGELRSEARTEAHKLRGSAGPYAFPPGAQPSRGGRGPARGRGPNPLARGPAPPAARPG